jgi:glutamyl-Q tRNA(Asp) synthetase
MSHSISQIPPQPAVPAGRGYRGRFAPSPTGPLHFGSLVSAVGSYLAARAARGAWLVRIEDVDVPRTVAGAADDILRTLEGLGLCWDETVLYQSRRSEAYRAAVQQLQSSGYAYPCTCSRREIADSALRGIEGQVYPGTCRNGPAAGDRPRAWRVRTDGIAFPAAGEGTIEFIDALQGRVTQHLASEIGDFVILRADGLYAYQLAVVVDDAFQGITHVVRGADLLASTARQIHLQRLLGLPTPAYMHLPVAVNARGEKLSKQTLAAPVAVPGASAVLVRALHFLLQRPPPELAAGRPCEILEWGVAHWDPQPLSGMQAQPE